jgi:release factor glutamine methyltransferase
MNILEAVKFGSNLLKEKKIPSYILDSELLLSKTLNKSREKILTNLGANIEKKNFNIYKKYLIRRSKNEPVAYILERKRILE